MDDPVETPVDAAVTPVGAAQDTPVGAAVTPVGAAVTPVGTPVSPVGAALDTPVEPAVDRAASLAVLGLQANSELAAFSRLAADAALAPRVDDRLELCRLGGAAADRLARVEARVVELGGRPADVVAPFLGTYTDFDARTPARSWWERMLKAYVGFGVEDDVARLLARGVDPVTRDLVLALLTEDDHGRLVVARVREAADADPALASRLALWGRRLVGEALGVVQRLAEDHPELRALLERALPADDGGSPLQPRLFAVLTAEHTRRMGRLGLTA